MARSGPPALAVAAFCAAGLIAGGCGDERSRAAENGTTIRSTVEVPVAVHAARFRRALKRQDLVGTLAFPHLGETEPIRAGFDQRTIDRGPSWYPGSSLPGAGRLVYLAGHHRSHGGPFGKVARLRVGDDVIMRVPYAEVTYTVTRRELISERDMSVLRSPKHEVLRLQTSTAPASDRRIIVTARRTSITPRRG